ncbi:MAG: tRNA uridine-5-carboxymethylaminomethyl(34) synthesis GTPase MnmE [Eubacterium sp.]
MNNTFLYEDTIAAIATGIGGAGIGIIRVSGKDAVSIVNPLFKNRGHKTIKEAESHKLLYGSITDPQTGKDIDEVLVSKMKGPFSYTAEDVVEINCHGGIVSLKKILDLVLKGGARLSEPGEFTKRAFLNGRLDLAQAEAVMDIISAKTEKSLAYSVSQLEGKLSEKLNAIEDILINMMATIEANIEYPEYDVEEASEAYLIGNIEKALAVIRDMLRASETGKIYREGITTAILGAPNVGKSSLLNTLLMENKAIVTEIPGTTRDVIEEYINVSGIPFKIIDTAGIRETDNLVEQIGVEKSRKLLKNTNLVLFMTDMSRPFTPSEEALIEELKDRKTIFIANKMDQAEISREIPADWLKMSIKENEGIDALRQKMTELVMAGTVDQDADYIITNTRHIHLLLESEEALKNALETIKMKLPLELISIDIQTALEKQREITGRHIGDDIVNQIFKNFCIGK